MSNVCSLIELVQELEVRGVGPCDISDVVEGLMESEGREPSDSLLIEQLGLASQVLWLLTFFKGDASMVRDALAAVLSLPLPRPMELDLGVAA